MKKTLTFMLAAVLLFACETRKSAEENQSETEAMSTSAISGENELREPEKEAGWKLLFNGENMDGWRTFKDRENDSWEVVDGTLHCKAKEAAEKRADLITIDQYGDFDLTFDWKIAPGDNSGVIYRATEENNAPFLSGPEYQIIDDEGYPDPLRPVQTSGSNYDMHAPPDDKRINPPGEWNTGRIVAKGNHVEHWLNGMKVVEYEINSEAWKKTKEGSKWKEHATYGASPRGHIDLQDHGGEVWFRNIKIKTL